MTLRQRRIYAWALLAAFIAFGTGWLLQLDYGRKISTDVLDLIPGGEGDAELALVRELASKAEARTMLFVLTPAKGAPVPLAVAQRFADELRRSAAFTQVVALGDPAWRDALGRELFDLRFPLLFPLWLREQTAALPPAGDPSFAVALAGRAAGELREFMARPEAMAFQDLIPSDPLLLLPRTLLRLKDSGLVVAGDPASGTGLVWAQIAASPLAEAGQKPVFAAITAAAAALRADTPSLAVAYTGVNRFAHASRARIEHEVTWLNTASLLAVLGVAVVFIRRVHRALHLVPVIGLAVLGAWVVTTMAFEHVHVIVFVLGALLAGVAIDYGFYLYMQPPAAPDEDYGAKVRRLAKPLLASCLTTVTGFALLLFSDLPMIRQLGVFVGAGLLCALGGAVAYFATIRNPFLEARTIRGGSARRAPLRRRLRLALVAAWIAALPGLARLSWRDDIRELEIPSGELRREDEWVRARFGDSGARTAYLTHGATLEAARASLERFESWLRQQRVAFANLAAIVPTREEFDRAREFLRHNDAFFPEFWRALEREGFTASEFAPAVERAARVEMDYVAAVTRLQSALTGPPGLLLHTGPQLNWFVTLAPNPPAAAPPAATHTVAANQLQSLNRLFADYRAGALRLSLAGLALVGAGVLLTYGVRDGIRIFAIPCGACLGIFGVFGWLGQPLNLFHLLGAFLGVCLTHNYSIFTATSAYRREPPPVSVRLSALTTAASFGVLALSGIPVVRALGTTVASMVLAALLVIELEHLSPLAQRE